VAAEKNKKEEKGAKDLLGMAYKPLLCLSRLTDASVDLNIPVYAEIATLSLWMRDEDDLTGGIEPFVLGQHTIAARKRADAKADRYTMVTGEGAAPTIADAKLLTAPDSVDLFSSIMKAKRSLSRTRVLAATVISVSHNTISKMSAFVAKIREEEVALEVYVPRDQMLVSQVPALITLWVHIRWDAWLEEQWEATDAVTFLNLRELWHKMRLKEPWEPTFPDGCAPAPISRFGMMKLGGADLGGNARRTDQAAMIAATVSAATGTGASTTAVAHSGGGGDSASDAAADAAPAATPLPLPALSTLCTGRQGDPSLPNDPSNILVTNLEWAGDC